MIIIIIIIGFPINGEYILEHKHCNSWNINTAFVLWWWWWSWIAFKWANLKKQDRNRFVTDFNNLKKNSMLHFHLRMLVLTGILSVIGISLGVFFLRYSLSLLLCFRFWLRINLLPSSCTIRQWREYTLNLIKMYVALVQREYFFNLVLKVHWRKTTETYWLDLVHNGVKSGVSMAFLKPMKKFLVHVRNLNLIYVWYLIRSDLCLI